jgi:hypothetical protein
MQNYVWTVGCAGVTVAGCVDSEVRISVGSCPSRLDARRMAHERRVRWLAVAACLDPGTGTSDPAKRVKLDVSPQRDHCWRTL